jgi:hypothetical protein
MAAVDMDPSIAGTFTHRIIPEQEITYKRILGLAVRPPNCLGLKRDYFVEGKLGGAITGKPA